MATIITLDIDVPNIGTVITVFNQIQVFRSITGINGTYSEITASANGPAQIDGTIAGTFTVNGLFLDIIENNGAVQKVIFSGADPFALQVVIDQINAVISTLASEVPTNTDKVRLTSSILGTGSALELSGDAAAPLGLSTVKVNGVANRIPLVPLTTEYLFQDLDGDGTFFYKTRFFDTPTGSIGTFSNPVKGTPSSIIADNLLSLATVDWSDGTGIPIQERRIIFVPISPTQEIGTVGVFQGADRIIIKTDSQGHAETNLAQGVTFRVFFEGSNFNREFVVPVTDPFDLLALITTSDDPLSIVKQPPRPIRRS